VERVIVRDCHAKGVVRDVSTTVWWTLMLGCPQSVAGPVDSSCVLHRLRVEYDGVGF
jgi:hypothetical protein